MREQGIGLEHHVDRPLIGRNAGHLDAVDEDLAVAGGLEPGQHAQKRGLAAAGRAQQRKKLAPMDGQIDLFHRDEIAEPLGDALEADQRHRLGIGPGSVSGGRGHQ